MARVLDAGVDTWSPCWYVDPGSTAAQMLSERATAGSGRGRLLPDAIDGHRVGWFEPAGLLYAEGHPGGDKLGRPADLPAALEQLVAAMRDDGVPVPEGTTIECWDGAVPDVGGRFASTRLSGFAGVRRLDATVDLATDSSAEGFAVLAGIAAVARDLPRSKANVWWDGQGRVQTIALHGHGGGKMLGRVYDKGAESGAASAGRLLRPEDQRRWPKAGRRDVTELTGQYVRQKFHQRFAPLWQASKGVTVAGPVVLAEKLVEAVEHGELTIAQAERLAGHLLVEAVASSRLHPSLRASRATRYRQRKAIRDHGLVLADGVLQEVEVDLADVLGRALESDAWGAGD